MTFNTQQLLYLVEIERTRSISQAAANLYMGQPNLSRVLRDMEGAAGFQIFERTRKGVRPTQIGEQFLQHARSILREAEFMERLGPNNAEPYRFRVCLPRSYRYAALTQQYLGRLLPEMRLDAMLRECHPRQALEMVSGGTAEIAVIRYSPEYQAYFEEQAQGRSLRLQRLSSERYQVVLSRSHPLAGETVISGEALEEYPEILHRDRLYSEKKGKNGIYASDRLSQLQLLGNLPTTYLWSEVLPQSLLQTAGLVQRPCEPGGPAYQTALLYNPRCAISALESGFLKWIQEKIQTGKENEV